MRGRASISCDTRDDVGAAVTIDVVNIHLRAAAAEIGGVEFPHGITGERGGLFAPH